MRGGDVAAAGALRSAYNVALRGMKMACNGGSGINHLRRKAKKKYEDINNQRQYLKNRKKSAAWLSKIMAWRKSSNAE